MSQMLRNKFNRSVRDWYVENYKTLLGDSAVLTD
jgi:hypothetical protein